MIKRTLLAGVATLTAVFGFPAAGQNPESKKIPEGNAAQRFELAKTIYLRTLDREVQRLLAPPAAAAAGPDSGVFAHIDGRLVERLADWSKRWLAAESEASPDDRAARLKAAQGHLDRMRELDDVEFLREPLKIGKGVRFKDDLGLRFERSFIEQFRDFSDAAHFFRLEAESLLAREKPAK